MLIYNVHHTEVYTFCWNNRICFCFKSQSKEKVMVMELCQGGSLYSLLEEPENHFGVPEDEFLTILKDIGILLLHWIIACLECYEVCIVFFIYVY